MRQKDVDVMAEVVETSLRFADDVSRPGVIELANELAKRAKYVNANLDVSRLTQGVILDPEDVAIWDRVYARAEALRERLLRD